MPTDLDGAPGGKPGLVREPSPAPRPQPKPSPWWARLDETKVTPRIALLFFLGLVVLSGMAAGVGFVAQHFRAAVSHARRG